MTQTKTDAVLILGDTNTEQQAEMFAVRAAEHGVIIVAPDTSPRG